MVLRLLLWTFLLISSISFSQEEWDRSRFTKDLKEDVNDFIYPIHKRAGNSFIKYFNDGIFDEGQEEYIYRLVTILRKKRFNDAADYFDLFRLLNHYGKGELNDESLDNFLAI